MRSYHMSLSYVAYVTVDFWWRINVWLSGQENFTGKMATSEPVRENGASRILGCPTIPERENYFMKYLYTQYIMKKHHTYLNRAVYS